MLSGKELTKRSFLRIDDRNFKCSDCGKKQAPNLGYINLSNHNKLQHPGWERSCNQNSLSFPKASKKAVNIHGWLDWDITDDLSFNLVHKATTRNYSNLEPICNPDSEKALSKSVQGEQHDEDRFMLRDLIEDDSFEVFDQSMSFADQVLAHSKETREVSLGSISPTSNRVERSFSTVKSLDTEYRKNHLRKLGESIFLKMNRSFWDVSSIEQCLNSL